MTPIAQDFDLQCRNCALDLQNALRALYAAVGADPARPQAVSRQFKLNKNLTWKVAKVIQSVDPIEAVPLIPGSEGMEILLCAMEASGPYARRQSVPCDQRLRRLKTWCARMLGIDQRLNF